MAGPSLTSFERLLAAEGLPTRLVPVGDEVPFETLLVQLESLVESEPTILELSFVPEMEEQLESAHLLQLFVRLPTEVTSDRVQDLLVLFDVLDTRLPLTGFVYLPAGRMAAFRNVAALPVDEKTAGHLVVQIVWLLAYLVAALGPLVLSVAAGASWRDALRGHEFGPVFAAEIEAF